MKKLLNILLFFSILPVFGNHGENDEVRLQRTISRSYDVNSNVSLEIQNKYGDLNIHYWDKDSVRLVIKITAEGKNNDAAKKLLDRVEFNFKQSKSFVLSETIFDRKTGVFQDVWSSFGDYSKNLLNTNKLRVNYEIYAPRKTQLKLDNKFGDIFLEESMGMLSINLANGYLKAGDLLGITTLNLSFCDADIRYIEKGELDLKVANVDLRKADALSLSSSGSEVKINYVKNLNMNSRNDKLNIAKVYQIFGEGSFSKLEITELNLSASLKLNYGNFAVLFTNADFSQLNVDSKMTDIRVGFARDAYFYANLEGREDRISMPLTGHSLNKAQVSDKTVNLTGDFGTKKLLKGQVNINADGGELELYLTNPIE